MKVIVIGAGMGGLALTQGLRRAGIETAVYDLDPDLAATGGYRLHLDHLAGAALHRLLPPPVLRAVLASSAHPRSFRQFALMDHRLRQLGAQSSTPGEDALMIGRIPLRRLLAHGLDVRFGAEFTDHEVHPDGSVTARFADGSTDRGDLLVGADGARSRVAAALAGRPMSRRLDATGIAGRTPLDAPAPGAGPAPHRPGGSRTVRELLPACLLAGPGLAIGPKALVFLSVHDPAAGPALASAGDVPAEPEDGTLVWGFTVPRAHLPAEPDPALHLAAGWPDPLRTVVAAADPTATAVYAYHSADPDADLTPWPSGPVTALGDAVHAMPPTGGQAAATAIRDADLLVQELVRRTSIPQAVHAYERAMPAYAVDAVRASLAPLRGLRALTLPGAHHAAGLALRAAGLVLR